MGAQGRSWGGGGQGEVVHIPEGFALTKGLTTELL